MIFFDPLELQFSLLIDEIINHLYLLKFQQCRTCLMTSGTFCKCMCVRYRAATVFSQNFLFSFLYTIYYEHWTTQGKNKTLSVSKSTSFFRNNKERKREFLNGTDEVRNECKVFINLSNIQNTIDAICKHWLRGEVLMTHLTLNSQLSYFHVWNWVRGTWGSFDWTTQNLRMSDICYIRRMLCWQLSFVPLLKLFVFI